MKGETAQALATADALVEESPQDVDARLLRARLLLADPKRTDAAWADAQAAVKADPASPAAQYTLGLVALARGDTPAAEAAFDRTVALNPRAGAASLQLAKLRLARGDTSAALTAAEGAVKARAGDTEAALRPRADAARAGRVRSRAPRADDAPGRIARRRSTSRRAGLGRSRRRPAGRRSRGIRAGARGGAGGCRGTHAAPSPRIWPRAISRARAHGSPAGSTAIRPTPRRQILAARVDLAARDAGAAERRLTAILRDHPDRLDAYELLGSLHVQQGNHAAALEQYRALAARAPEPTVPGTIVGILLEATGDRNGARTQYEAVLAKDPRAGVAANNLAWMLADDGRHAEALRWARVAVERLRNRPEPHDTLGWVYLKNNQPVDAIAEFTKALDLAPQSKVYRRASGQGEGGGR